MVAGGVLIRPSAELGSSLRLAFRRRKPMIASHRSSGVKWERA